MYDCCVGACYGSCIFTAFRRTCVIVVGPSCYSHGGNSHVLFVGVHVLKACSQQSAILYFHSCQSPKCVQVTSHITTNIRRVSMFHDSTGGAVPFCLFFLHFCMPSCHC